MGKISPFSIGHSHEIRTLRPKYWGNGPTGSPKILFSDTLLGNTTQNWLGRSQPPGDPYPDGALDDFRIYSRALRDQDVQELFKSGRPFRISQVLGEASGGLQLTWNSSPDVVVYIIWSCTDLTSGDWTAEATVPSAGASTSWTDPSPGGSQKFYRIQQF